MEPQSLKGRIRKLKIRKVDFKHAQEQNKQKLFLLFRYGLVARIPLSHSGGQGSIPCSGTFFLLPVAFICISFRFYWNQKVQIGRLPHPFCFSSLLTPFGSYSKQEISNA